jgi:hypothetical protein
VPTLQRTAASLANSGASCRSSKYFRCWIRPMGRSGSRQEEHENVLGDMALDGHGNWEGAWQPRHVC